MVKAQRVAFVTLVVAAAVGGVIDASIYAAALTNIGGGDFVPGFDSLSLANHLAAVVAGLAALAVVVRTLGAHRRAVPAFTLLLMSGITALIAGGLFTVGRALFRVSNEAIRDNLPGAVPGSHELRLNSLISAVMGSGYDLAPVPVVLAIAAVLVPLIAIVRSVYARRSIAVPTQVAA